ncbi:hypothetical protein [Geitlerinema sp. PCC 9228]|jgi:hypothetical protein|uniref:hypothetical protein n=1 Tax=Geitlerinema sp. PCC 9228 TaxID=111611 RepID=UPI0008F9B965|nr:hypothetical protein [Geitlerinema sp. PCC 9228]
MLDPNRLPTPKFRAFSQQQLRLLRAQARNLARPPVWGSALLVIAAISLAGSYVTHFNEQPSQTATDARSSTNAGTDAGNLEQEELAKTLAEKETRAQAADIESSSVLLQELENTEQQENTINPEQDLSSQHGVVSLQREVMANLVPEEVRQQMEKSNASNSGGGVVSGEVFGIDNTFLSSSEKDEENKSNNPFVSSTGSPANGETSANARSGTDGRSLPSLNAHPNYNPIGGIDVFSAIQSRSDNSSTSTSAQGATTSTGEGQGMDFLSPLQGSSDGNRQADGQQTPIQRDVRTGSQVYPPGMDTTSGSNPYAYPLPDPQTNTNSGQGRNDSAAGNNPYATPLPNTNGNAGVGTNDNNMLPSQNSMPTPNPSLSPANPNGGGYNWGTNATQGSFSVRGNPYNRGSGNERSNRTGNTNNRWFGDSRQNTNPNLNQPATNGNNPQQVQPFSAPRPVPGRNIGGGRINTFSNP